MKLSSFREARDKWPKPWEVDWQTFTETFGPHRLLDVDVEGMSKEDLDHYKEGLGAFSPAEYPEGVARAKSHVLRVHLLVLDVDDKSEDELLDFIERAKGLAMVVHSTFSRGIKPGARARVVIPLSRPVRRDEWDLFWRLTNYLFEGIGDAQCKDANRLYFGCFAPVAKQDDHFYEVFCGEPLNVDEVLALKAQTAVPQMNTERVRPVSVEQVKAIAERLARRADPKVADVGRAMKRMCDGEVIADVGDRDVVMFDVVGEIVKRYPNVDPASVGQLFSKSIELMTDIDSSCPQVDNIEYKVANWQKHLAQKKLEEEQEQFRVRRKRIEQAFGVSGIERTEPYTDEELEAIGDVDWVVQRGGSYYIFNGDRYVGPFTDTDAQNAALSLLSPVKEEVVDLFNHTEKGATRKSINQLVAEYGSVAQELCLDLRAQKSTFDSKQLIFTEAPCPMRPIEPKHHEGIARWLEILGGDKYHDLKSWLAAVTMLDKPCSALFITGPKNIGKNLLAEGVARLWTTEGPSDLEEVFSNFNDALARCPLCFADEQLPKDNRGYTKSGELRTHIQARSRPYKRKFLPAAKLIGATRTIIAANNDDILRTQETLTANDIGAIADRYFHIEAYEDVRRYLESVDTSGWVEGDMIAEHALWLRDNHKWQEDGRFLIRVKDKTLARKLAVAGGPSSAVCQWLVSFLQYPEPYEQDPKGKGFVRVDEKQRLLVNVQGVLDCWEKYISNDKCPSTGRLATAITTISHPDRVQRVNELGVKTNYRVIDIENLIAWAERTGFATREAIENGLKRESVLTTPETAQERIARRMN